MIHNKISPDSSDESFATARMLVAEFSKNEGRNPRILLSQMGWDERKLKAKSLSVEYANLGFDVDIGPRFQNPAEIARQAIENDVHFIEIYDLDPQYVIIVSEILAELKNLNREDILVIAEGPLRNQDYKYLYKEGVTAIFSPSVSIPESTTILLPLLLQTDRGKMVS